MYPAHRPLHPFPTRRSSDLNLAGASLRWTNLAEANLEGADLRGARLQRAHLEGAHLEAAELGGANLEEAYLQLAHLDRKSTRLNSSHSQISYAVFCLKKKKT